MVPKEVLLQCSLTEKNERLAVSAVFHSRRIFAEGLIFWVTVHASELKHRPTA